MDTRRFHKRLSDTARRLIPRHATIVCAVSGGADSVAMLHGLVKVNEIHDCAWRIHVAHLNHGLREEAQADAAFVREMADAIALSCTLESADVRGESLRRGETIEEAARSMRYAFLANVAEEIGSRIVAAGHHLDDQAETVLHHIARGTGLRGLAGMRESRPISEGSGVLLVRPLLGFSRDEIHGYLHNRGFAFCDDKTNANADVATRNAIRHEILPLLRQRVNPEIASALARLASHARRADEALTNVAENALNRAVIHRTATVFVLSIEAVAAWPVAVQAEVLRAVLRQLGVRMRDVGAERIESVLDLVRGENRRRMIELPGGGTAERRGSEIRIEV